MCLHMVTMRQSYKKLLKKQFKNERENLIASYDYVKDEVIYAVENELESYEVHCNINDLRVLEAFLKAYIPKLEKELTAAKVKDSDDQLKHLKKILEQCEVQMSA